MARQDLIKITEAEMEHYYSFLQASSALLSLLEGMMPSISAKDITNLLKKQFAFLSGGRGKESDYIITFPEYPQFCEIPEDEIKKVLAYLAAVPSEYDSAVKFILVIDRRLDTWTNVKTTLSRIANSFPGNLHLVLVLRPTGFFQRTFTDIGFRFSQDDFILRLPVVMLSSVAELLKYIDENQLTTEFGGTLEYCHSDWIIFRTAIESFAVTVKEIAQMLQAFGTELAEAELPEDAHAMEYVLISRTEKYNQLKGDITAVMKQGDLLLNNLEEPSTAETDSGIQSEKHGDWETIQRLLKQLHEMETAFDGFWEKYQLKLEQYLQLWRFEQNFREMKNALELLSVQESDLPSTGDSISQVEQVQRDLSSLDERVKDVTGRAHLVILQGNQLASNHHYAIELICQRCNQLRHFCDVLDNKLSLKDATLNKTLELHKKLKEVLQWCDDGAYLLANQQMDKCQSKEGAQRALQDIDEFLENSYNISNFEPQIFNDDYESIFSSETKDQVQMALQKLEHVQGMFQSQQACLKKVADKQIRPVQLVAPRPENPPRAKSPLFSPKHGKKPSRKNQSSPKIEVIHDYQEKRSPVHLVNSENEDGIDALKRHAIFELIETERIYVEELALVLEGYREEMDNPAMCPLMPTELKMKRDILFGNMPEIFDFHKRVFLQELEICAAVPERVGTCFLEKRENFQLYKKYCQNKPQSEALWRQFSDCIFFQECQKKLEHKLALDSYLLKPVQRLTKYQLLLKELLKYTSNGDGVQDLNEALAAMLDLLKSVNDSMHQIAITGYEGDLNEFGKVLMQGSFSVWISHKKGHTKMKDLARFKSMQRHLFLHEKALVFCKKREDHGDSYDKTASYSFKHYLKMNAVGITENVKGDARKFEVWYSGREEVYIVQAPTVEEKMAWLNEIRKILTNQQKLLKESQYPNQGSDQVHLSPPLNDGKHKRTSVSSEENDSESTSPTTLDSLPVSPQHLPQRKSWSVMSSSVEICEGLECWSSNNELSNSEEEDDTNLLSPGKYKALIDCKITGSEEMLIKSGDTLELIQEDPEGQWLVKNLSRNKERWISYNNLLIIIGDAKSTKSSDSGPPTERKFSS
ncbi:proto-oncogene DBL [Protopterus annectens]|uniref:proto-oncogene DBL n=1 Tax=Protopterus annectens TaxID=7888 RepID=UPI001CF9C399|nr:proto-oncogene DBL [Protopterus annectens]